MLKFKNLKLLDIGIINALRGNDFRQTAKNQLWRLISGPLILVFIPLYLTPEAQGYWYAFMSLGALVVFADLGFTTILLQFSAHEFSRLDFGEKNILIGSRHSLERISTLFRFALKWALLVSAMVTPIILLAGFLILEDKKTDIEWMPSWAIYSVCSVIVFLNGVVLSFLEGCNSVGEIHRIRFRIGVITSTTMILLLFFGAELYALAVSLAIGAITGTVNIVYRYRNLLAQLLSLGKRAKHQWNREIFPLLGRYAITFISGYATFSLFTVVAFKFYGVIEAGKVGFSIAICTAIFGIANIWITIIVPKINMFVANKNYASLDYTFKKHLSAAVITYVLGIMTLFTVVIFLKDLLPIADRLVSIFSLAAIALVWLIQIIINACAVYLRAHKSEPLMITSVVGAIFVTISTFLTSLYLPFEYFFIGFLATAFLMLPWILKIFFQYRTTELANQYDHQQN